MVNKINPGSAVAEPLLRKDFYQNRHEYDSLKTGSVISPDGSGIFTVAFSIPFILNPLLSSVAEILSQVSMTLK